LALLEGEHLEAWADWQMHDREQKRAAELLARGLLDSASYDRAIAEAVSAEARFVQSESRLRLAGLAATDVRELRERKTIASRFAVRATMDGVLLERIAPLGIILEPGSVLARIGDPAGLWIEAQVRESDLSRVALGQQVEFSADGNAMQRATGEVIWIAQFLDPHSRTATVRVRPSHNIDILRAHGFGRVAIAESGTSSAVMVPRDAVQWEGCCNVVFVREAPDRFRPHKVEVARGNASHYRVLEGLNPADEVVVRGSFLLKTELKKGSIGAGCCGLEASS
jgi:cobalt-zinc-cadmium efflux system membrane fusion protein